MHTADWQEDIKNIINKWLESDEGLQFEAEVYQIGFDEGWDNALASQPAIEYTEEDEDWWDDILSYR
jgi:hypothetical protein